jgi:hypothetical protein
MSNNSKYFKTIQRLQNNNQYPTLDNLYIIFKFCKVTVRLKIPPALEEHFG